MAHSSAVAEGSLAGVASAGGVAFAGPGGVAFAGGGASAASARQGGVTSADGADEALAAGQPGGGPSGWIGVALAPLAFCNGGWLGSPSSSIGKNRLALALAGGPGGFLFGGGGNAGAFASTDAPRVNQPLH